MSQERLLIQEEVLNKGIVVYEQKRGMLVDLCHGRSKGGGDSIGERD